MKRLMLGSLLSCLVVGQVFGADNSSDETLFFTGVVHGFGIPLATGALLAHVGGPKNYNVACLAAAFVGAACSWIGSSFFERNAKREWLEEERPAYLAKQSYGVGLMRAASCVSIMGFAKVFLHHQNNYIAQV